MLTARAMTCLVSVVYDSTKKLTSSGKGEVEIETTLTFGNLFSQEKNRKCEAIVVTRGMGRHCEIPMRAWLWSGFGDVTFLPSEGAVKPHLEQCNIYRLAERRPQDPSFLFPKTGCRPLLRSSVMPTVFGYEPGATMDRFRNGSLPPSPAEVLIV
jgi:hypothetical protein